MIEQSSNSRTNASEPAKTVGRALGQTHGNDWKGKMKIQIRLCMAALAVALGNPGLLLAQSKDPGPRPLRANPNVPPMVAGASATDSALFSAAAQAFMQEYSVDGTWVMPKGTVMTGVGLGPRFNHFNCSSCHRIPFMGGSSFAQNSQALLNTNTLTDYGLIAPNQATPKPFQQAGPTMAARLKFKADGTRDGAVYPFWVISGRPDAPGCSIQPTDWNAEFSKNNVTLRITTPTFGAGYVEAISDAAIIANKAAFAAQKAALGISGHENRNTTDGTISKFGWKAQTRTLKEFTADALVNEMGVTNAGAVNENDPNCNYHAGIEDVPVATPNGPMPRADLMTHLMKFLAQPAPAPATASTVNGASLFQSVGCVGCHTISLTTAATATPSVFANKQVPLYSDLLVHRMGAGLADEVIQGQAGPDEFRTAPLWGIGQRYYFLHDGRTSDLKAAIAAHASPATVQYPASEANAVVNKWNALSETQKQDILNFLRGL